MGVTQGRYSRHSPLVSHRVATFDHFGLIFVAICDIKGKIWPINRIFWVSSTCKHFNQICVKIESKLCVKIFTFLCNPDVQSFLEQTQAERSRCWEKTKKKLSAAPEHFSSLAQGQNLFTFCTLNELQTNIVSGKIWVKKSHQNVKNRWEKTKKITAKNRHQKKAKKRQKILLKSTIFFCQNGKQITGLRLQRFF